VAVCIFGLSPGYLDDVAVYSHGENTLNEGFMKAFGISDRLATILSFPALYGSTALFIYGYCKQLKALSRSKLIPAAFSWTFPHSNIPYFNLIVMTTLNYLLLVIIHVALSSTDSTTGRISHCCVFLVLIFFLLFFFLLGLSFVSS
jgi:amino acid transporter